MKSVLVACPTALVKDYALDAYLAGFEALEYDNRDLLMVDTTDDEGEYASKLLAMGVNVVHIDPDREGGGLYATIDRAWEVILKKGSAYDYVLSLESDTVIAPEGLTQMVAIANMFRAVVVRHAYMHRKVSGYAPNLGILLLRRDAIGPILDRKDENGVYVHESRRFMIESLQSGMPVFDVYNLFETHHHLEDGVIEKKVVWGHGIKAGGIGAPE
jgi:hypothetical protein